MECRLSGNVISRRRFDAPKRRYFGSCVGRSESVRIIGKKFLETRLPFRNDGMRFYRVYDTRNDALLTTHRADWSGLSVGLAIRANRYAPICTLGSIEDAGNQPRARELAPC